MVNSIQQVPTSESIFLKAESLFSDIERLPPDTAANVADVIEKAASWIPYSHKTAAQMLQALAKKQAEVAHEHSK